MERIIKKGLNKHILQRFIEKEEIIIQQLTYIGIGLVDINKI